MWDECVGFPVSLASYLWRAFNHNSPAAAYEAERDIHCEAAAVEPLDFAIIHRPKSLPCARRAIFIPQLNGFSLSYTVAQTQGWDFYPLKTVFGISDVSYILEI